MISRKKDARVGGSGRPMQWITEPKERTGTPRRGLRTQLPGSETRKEPGNAPPRKSPRYSPKGGKKSGTNRGTERRKASDLSRSPKSRPCGHLREENSKPSHSPRSRTRRQDWMA
eukprot:5948670-Heterocapsa_arctica.AAC.1